jgi:hypothetical protein
MIAAGLKPSHIEMRRIVAEANSYIEAHRDELLDQAAETVRNVPGLRTLAEREARERRRNQRDRDSADYSKPNTTSEAERRLSASRVSYRSGSGAIDRDLAKTRPKLLSPPHLLTTNRSRKPTYRRGSGRLARPARLGSRSSFSARTAKTELSISPNHRGQRCPCKP